MIPGGQGSTLPNLFTLARDNGDAMTHHKVWDLFVRLFHWSLVTGFAANALLTNP
jgi:hypothetical protein